MDGREGLVTGVSFVRDPKLEFNFFIYKNVLEESDVAFLNSVCDKLLENELAEKYDASKYLAGKIHPGGQVTIPSKIFVNLFPKIKEFSCDYVEELSGHKYQASDIAPISYWLVSSRGTDYNPLHIHSGVLSGIVYLKVPSDLGEIHDTDGCITFSHGRLDASHLDFSGIRTVRPHVGEIYLFPSWLSHTVYPSNSSEERRALSFNLDLKVNRKNQATKDF